MNGDSANNWARQEIVALKASFEAFKEAAMLRHEQRLSENAEMKKMIITLANRQWTVIVLVLIAALGAIIDLLVRS